ncbi:MAG: membrane protein [Candidatus Kapaibacterium sp.]|nr:MAG: membrane protein [Candidatus Kapabacteria bacterium]GIV55355.1 MAG: membrane protein [Candidatus Kapabacteria bacterium]
MGFYIRKALKVGPLRFNLSKSGVGVSAGIKGLRLGTGPRGYYVHMGRGGLYFRKSLSSPGGRAAARAGTPQHLPGLGEPSGPEVPLGTVEPLHDVESASVQEMVDASSAELLREMNEKRKKVRLLPGAIALSIIGTLLLFAAGMPTWLIVLLGTLAIGFCWLASMKDELRKTTVILYDLEPEVESAYERLHDAFGSLRSCSRIWHIEARGEVRDRKYHAGASGVVKRKQISLTTGGPPFVKTNVEVPLVPVGKQVLAFMPDRLLVFEPAAVGAISYSALNLSVAEIQFIEEESVPHDATVVGRTWRYVNKKGGPDRRFKDNREIPICAYEQIHLSSSTGLNEVILVSKRGASTALSEALSALQGLRTDEGATPAV